MYEYGSNGTLCALALCYTGVGHCSVYFGQVFPQPSIDKRESTPHFLFYINSPLGVGEQLELNVMKKFLFFFISSICFVACGDSGPTAAEEPYLKSFILRNSIDYEWKQSLKDELIGEIYLGNITIEGFDIPHTDEDQPRSFSEAVLILFENNVYITEGGEKKLRESWMNSLDYDLERDWWDRMDKVDVKSTKLCQTNPQQAKILYDRLITKFFEYLQNVANEQIEVISWEYDLINTGDSYTAYNVVYQLGTGFYILVNLVEFDNDDRYEYKILNKANSLTEINDYI